MVHLFSDFYSICSVTVASVGGGVVLTLSLVGLLMLLFRV